MERHTLGEKRAFALLREHARDSRRRLVDVPAGVIDGRALLPKGAEGISLDRARAKGQLTEVPNGYITSCARLVFAPQRELAV